LYTEKKISLKSRLDNLIYKQEELYASIIFTCINTNSIKSRLKSS